METLLFSMQAPVIGSQWFLLSHKLNITLFQKIPLEVKATNGPADCFFEAEIN